VVDGLPFNKQRLGLEITGLLHLLSGVSPVRQHDMMNKINADRRLAPIRCYFNIRIIP
jgi:hypothetical protein